MPRGKKQETTEPTVAPGVSNGAGAGPGVPPQTTEPPAGLWPKLQGLGQLGAQAFTAWRTILDREGLVLLYGEPARGLCQYTLVDPTTGEAHAWQLQGSVTPDLALVRLLCLPVPALEGVVNTPQAPAAAPKAAPPAPTPAPAPTEPPEQPQDPQEDVWAMPARATTVAKARKLIMHDMLPPPERQRATAYLDIDGRTEGQVLGCISALEKQIATAILDLEQA